MKTYNDSVHFYGRIWVALGIFLMIMVPVSTCVYYDAWPAFEHVFKGLLGVAPIFWTVGIIEVFTYAPMLGTGGTYLGFITGNLTTCPHPAPYRLKPMVLPLLSISFFTIKALL